MKTIQPDLQRRAFLRQACCAAVGTTGILSALSQLKLVGAKPPIPPRSRVPPPPQTIAHWSVFF